MPPRKSNTGRETARKEKASRPARTSRDAADDDKLAKMFQSLVKNVFGVIMVTADDGTVQYVTPSVKRALGYDPVDLFGKKAYEYFKPEDAKNVKRIMKKTLTTGEGSEPFDVRAKSWDGKYHVCQMVIHNLVEGLAFSFHDVTDQRHAEEALRRSEERYRKAFRSSPDSITITEMATGRFIEVNEGFTKMSGYTHEEVIGRTSKELGIWKDPDARDSVVRRLKRDGSVRDFETDFVTKDGDVLACLVSSEWFELQNKRCLVLIARDITDRKLYEKKLKRTSSELERERQELTEKNIALKQILDHIEQEKAEFRNEMTSRIETILNPVLDRLKKSGGRLNKKEIAQLQSGIDSIVGSDVSRFQENLTKLTPRELDICELIKKGFSSKEIATYLNVSVQTVHKHRQLIRRKLQINNQDVNLAAYLRLR
ncbi:MAG: PAS domain S-box protein [Candidatus Latescibacterota bacterium]